MKIPHNVDTKSIKTHCFNHLKSMLPIFMWDTRIMYFSSKDLLGNV